MKPFDRFAGAKESEYQRFLATPVWAQIRETVIRRDGGQCRICGCREQLQAHHIRYQDETGRRAWTDTDWIVTLCAPCHEIVTGAVERAKSEEVTVTATLRGIRSYTLWTAIRQAKQAQLIEALFCLWRRTLREDARKVNFRNLAVLRPIARIVRETLKYQAWGEDEEDESLCFAEALIRRITASIAEEYRQARMEGRPDSDFRRRFGLSGRQMVRVRQNADNILRGGDDDIGSVPSRKD